MKYVIQFLIIAAFSFAGELLHHFIPLPIPASIYGIVLLFTALELKVVKVLMDSWGAIKSSILEYAIITVISTFVVMGVAGAVTQTVIKRGHKNADN